VLAALCSGLVLASLALAAHAPPFRVRTVSWTGPLLLPEKRCAAIESACLGRPLLLLSERALLRALDVDERILRLRIGRHLPGTLELRVEPRRAVARLDARTAIDARGRRLGPEHAVAGLPLLTGFALEPSGERLDRDLQPILGAVRELFELPTLAPSEVRLAGRELELVLADSGSRVRLDAAHAADQLLKLRIFEESLGGEPLPAAIDLRFADQVVVREGGIRRASRRSR
jgi:cell division septal protein FtsQ